MKKKRSLVALLLVAILGLVGGTFAYFTSSDDFENIFQTSEYKMEVKEIFTSPTNWVPGTTTTKRVFATNKGSVEAAVRVYYEEEWVDKNGSPLPNSVGRESAAILNHPADFASKWIESEENGITYYYYYTRLGTNATTSDFLSSVTFNPNVEISATHNCDTTTQGQVTCTTSTTGYGGGTYTLTIHVETVQRDKYLEAWGTSVEIQ